MSNGDTVGKWCWHVHHEALCEVLTEPIEVRLEYVRTSKPPHEVPIRERLMKLVVEPLPTLLVGAGDAYKQAWVAYKQAGDAYKQVWVAYKQVWVAYKQVWVAYKQVWVAYKQAGDSYDQAWVAYVQARVACLPELLALHAIECGCEWTSENGIKFPSA